jgi:ABC-type dipeptide/oligopeptide/nickel transport system permease component
LTVVGIGTAGLLAGAPVIEVVFTWPGVGRYTVQAIQAGDVPVVQGYTLLAVFAYVAVSLIVDIVVRLIDPRRQSGTVANTRRRRMVELDLEAAAESADRI